MKTTHPVVSIIMGLLSCICGCKAEEPFEMTIDNVFYIHANGGFHVLQGKVTSGQIKINDFIMVNNKEYKVTGIESLRKEIQLANSGEDVGLAIRGQRSDVFKKGDVIKKSIKSQTDK